MPKFDVSQRPGIGFRDPLRTTKAKVRADIKQMILGALDALGGQAYLERQAIENPVAFMSLLGKILPTELKATVRYDIDDVTTAELIAIASGREGTAEAESPEELRSVH